MSPKIAYIMSRFPHLPETFILREITELENKGWEIALYPLIFQHQSVVHGEAKHWLPRVRHLPYVSSSLITANIHNLTQYPHRYISSLTRALWENRSDANFFLRAIALFPKAVHMARLMKEEGITHIHAHYATHPALVAWLIHRLTGISYSVTVHAHDIFVSTAMLAAKLSDAAFIVAISEYNRNYLTKVIGPWVTEKTHIIHCGITPRNYVQVAPSSHSDQSEKRFEIVSIGSLQPYKGFPYLIQACALLHQKGVPLHCRIIGDGEDRPELEKMIATARLETVIELLGPRTQEEVARILPTAHCYVQPSIITSSGKMEGIPVAIMEALACELPVVATSISGIPELVRPGETGYLVPPADTSALADALTTIYVDPQKAIQMGRAGRTLVLGEFELSANVEQLSALFKRVTMSSALNPLYA